MWTDPSHACAHHGALSPQVDNTNVDRSVATLHTTVLRCLARTAAGETLFDPVRPTQRRCTPTTAPLFRPCLHTLTTARPPSSPQVRQQIVVMNEVFESHNRATWSSKAMLQVHACAHHGALSPLIGRDCDAPGACMRSSRRPLSPQVIRA